MNERPRERPNDGGGAVGRGDDLDHTREFEGPGDRPAGRPLDETAAHRALDDTAPGRPVDNAAGPGIGGGGHRPEADQTRRLGAADQTRSLPVTPGAWSGRAGVPPRTMREVRETGPVAWETSADQDGRRWWMPILIGIIALLLLGILAFGIWLILKSQENEPGPPSPSPSVSSTTPSASPTPAPTTSQPTPSATAPAKVTVPTLVGLPEQEARAKLDELGLPYRLQFRESDQPPGTVIATDPKARAEVDPDTVVTLVIAQSPPAPPPTSAGPSLPNASPTAIG